MAVMARTPDEHQELEVASEDERARVGAGVVQPLLIGFVLAAIIGAITLATFWGH